ncbi:flavodoxin domain-containing protein [Bacillus sp. cl95]|uniref:flavodoxin domain-containing protein n=1 Tax=Bacillus sp. cl95 TaxID=1761761 RepID=UPI0034A3CD5E
MNCRKKVAIIYASITGNTKELIEILCDFFQEYPIKVYKFQVGDFQLPNLSQFDAVIIGTYTWGSGEIPEEMIPIYQSFEMKDVNKLVTGVAGTGDKFYPNYCGAVDKFRDMLFVHTELAATLKIELNPQTKDLTKCKQFVDSLVRRMA